MGSNRKAKWPGWPRPNLRGKVAVVTGATRGVGRGITLALAECGATVYVTGRSTRLQSTTDDLPGTIEDAAEDVTARGGIGVPIRCDFTSESDVRFLFDRIRREEGRLDLLVNNAWGGYEQYDHKTFALRFWDQPFEQRWQGMIQSGLRAHLLASYHAIPLLIAGRRGRRAAPGLIVSTVAWDHGKYLGNFYDVTKHAIVRMIYGLSLELKPHNVAAVAVAPGFTRTERILQAYKVGERTWRKASALKNTESPEYIGRGIALLAADRSLLRKSGKAFRAGELARSYKFTDVDGRRVPPFSLPPADKMVALLRTKK